MISNSMTANRPIPKVTKKCNSNEICKLSARLLRSEKNKTSSNNEKKETTSEYIFLLTCKIRTVDLGFASCTREPDKNRNLSWI